MNIIHPFLTSHTFHLNPASSTTAPAFGTVSAASTASLLVNSTAGASVFGSDIDKNPVQAAKVQLPEQVARETGEESESTLFSGNGVLFEWSDASKQWRERGRGEVRVNIHTSSGQGRIVMRQKGNLRVLLNANLWPDMALTLMDGKAGVTFACVNHVFMTDVAEESVAGHIDGKLMTYALRISPIETLDTFINVVNENKRRSAA